MKDKIERLALGDLCMELHPANSDRNHELMDKARQMIGRYHWQRDLEQMASVMLISIDTLTRQLEEARAALRPFANYHGSDEFIKSEDDDGICAATSFRVGDYRRARAALAEHREHDHEG